MSYKASIQSQSGYILHTRPYRETSLLLEAFTPEFGRVGLVVRGVRGKKSKNQGLIQPLVPLLLSWTGRGELHTLLTAEPRMRLPQKQGRMLMSCLYVNEILLRLLHRNDAHPELFYFYERFLTELNEDNEEVMLRIFEKRLLNEIGYGLVLDMDADNGERIKSDRMYQYIPEHGLIVAGENNLKGMSIPGKSLLALSKESFEDKEDLKNAKRLLRAIMDVQLGSKPLNSRLMYQSLNRQTRKPVIEDIPS
ncbi:MAG: DNA repair protein RecO [Gammaproteobacteria bacterium]|nr:DNA repair protein RecO [Gammaproteobacteria bacterium]